MTKPSMKALIKDGKQIAVHSTPQPEITDDSEAIIQVKLAGLCRTDIYVAEGKINSAGSLVLGHEFSGTVVNAGDQAGHLSPGDRVTVNPLIPCRQCHFCVTGAQSICQKTTFLGVDRNGCFADFVKVPISSIHQLPQHISFMSAAYAEPVAAGLAVLKSGILPQDKGLIYGQNRFAQLMQKILKVHEFRDIPIYDPQDKGSRLDDDTYDFIIETVVSTEALADLVRAVRPGGKIILKSRMYEPVMFKMLDVIKKEPVLHVVNYGSFEDALNLLCLGQVEVEDLVDGVYRLEEFQKVLTRAKQRESLKPFFSPGDN